MNKKFDLLLQAHKHGPSSHVKSTSSSSLCLICKSLQHVTHDCHLASKFLDFVEEQAKAINSFQWSSMNNPYFPIPIIPNGTTIQILDGRIAEAILICNINCGNSQEVSTSS